MASDPDAFLGGLMRAEPSGFCEMTFDIESDDQPHESDNVNNPPTTCSDIGDGKC